MSSIELAFDAETVSVAGNDLFRIGVTIHGLVFSEKRIERIGKKVEESFLSVFDGEKLLSKGIRLLPKGATFFFSTIEKVESSSMKKMELNFQSLIRERGL